MFVSTEKSESSEHLAGGIDDVRGLNSGGGPEEGEREGERRRESQRGEIEEK